MAIYRIHGDNIIECERILDFIMTVVDVKRMERGFSSLACMKAEMSFAYMGEDYHWGIEMFPGYTKSTRDRWSSNIFAALKENGSFLDETPDAIVTKVEGESETILYAIEFCSALQAGNQAWQRSGRAYSTGRTGCPYIYIVDFVKYELDSARNRKALRFPNPAVPYSYVNFSRQTGSFVAQAYVKSEEFQPDYDLKLSGFDESIFAEKEIADYMVMSMIGADTSSVERKVLDKNMRMVSFLSQDEPSTTCRPVKKFTREDWHRIYETRNENPFSYAIKLRRFNFVKIRSDKSKVGKGEAFGELVRRSSVGCCSADLPFGIIPRENRAAFTERVALIYGMDLETRKKLSSETQDLVICMIKGFKPRGDDNRPDRGVLPLVAMLDSEEAEILTYIYGPIIEGNYKKLKRDPVGLGRANGFWKSFLALSDYILLDGHLPISELPSPTVFVQDMIDNTEVKKEYLRRPEVTDLTRKAISPRPNGYHEDDVDTVIHAMFKYLISADCFEGMCNPPGGDWSGMSVVYRGKEYRWLSLPRVSPRCKRPDHVIEIFNFFEKPLLLTIESKEHGKDLEACVGPGLKGYIEWLMSHTASVEKTGDRWEISETRVPYDQYEVVSAGAYIAPVCQEPVAEFRKSQCDMMFVFWPDENKTLWNMRIFSDTEAGKKVEEFIRSELAKSSQSILNVIP